MSRHRVDSAAAQPRLLEPWVFLAAHAGLAVITAISLFLVAYFRDAGWLGVLGLGLVGWVGWPGYGVRMLCPDPGCLSCAEQVVSRRARLMHPDETSTITTTLRRAR